MSAVNAKAAEEKKPVTAATLEAELTKLIGPYYDDPYGFVMRAFPWGQPGPLEAEAGPDKHQREFLNSIGNEVRARKFNGFTPVMPIRMAESSGHGTGKTAMGAWITAWILSTRPDSIGTITAGTATQLSERTFAAIAYWMGMCVTRQWFEVMAAGIYSRIRPETWKVVTQTCREENSQSFAGQHARTSTSWYLFDEASTVPDGIWKVAFGGLTDGEPMFFCWGQPERNTGKFYEICFGREGENWNRRTVDSRTSRFTNKALIKEWIDAYGIDSDWCRVRIFGLPPSASELQFIDSTRILAAQKRAVETLPDEPLIAGFDVSGGGNAWNVIRFRCGLDASSIPPIKISGEKGRDRSVLVSAAAEVLRSTYSGRKVAAMFVDSAFGAAVVERLHVLGHSNAIEVNFGGPSPNIHQANQRAYMWNSMKDWLQRGAIDSDIKLELGLSRPGYHINPANKLVLESKQDMAKRGESSPDDADALALTWAQPVALKRKIEEPDRPSGPMAWMG